VQEAERETGTQAPPVAGVHAGTARPARRRVALTQNQLKLCACPGSVAHCVPPPALTCLTPPHFTAARLDSTQRKLRSTIRSRNEKALAQLRGAGACLQRATVAVQNAKRTADAALEELASRLQVPSGLSSPKAGDAKTSAAL